MTHRLLALAALVLLAGCGGSVPPAPTAVLPPPATATAFPPTPTPSPTPTVTATPSAETSEIPDSPVGQRLAWVLDTLLTQPEGLDPDEVVGNFTNDFLEQVPATNLLDGLVNFRQTYGPTHFVRFSAPPSVSQATGSLASASGDTFAFTIVVEETEPYRISGLAITLEQGSQPTPVPLTSWDEFDNELTAAAAQVNFLAAEIDDGACVPVHALNAGTPLALGSAFKLYILGELAHQVAQGTLHWDDQLTVEDDLKSLPSGKMQHEPAGTTHSLRYFAEQMISISDNTAADHLLARLGREQVEDYQEQMGLSQPELNEPFLSTREMFTLKLALTNDNLQRYIDADPAERRRELAEEIDPLGVTASEASGWSRPLHIDSIEWFASAEDLCRAMSALRTLSEQPGLEPVRDILSINPGVPFDPATWTYIGYKGGSEPGVLNLTWLLQRADGRWFVLTAGFNDPHRNIDANGAIGLLQAGAALLASAP